jgi:hypothetical protein
MMKEDLLPAKQRLLAELALIQVEIDRHGLEKIDGPTPWKPVTIKLAEEDIVKVEETNVVPEEAKVVEEVKIVKKRGRPSKTK